MKGDLRQIFFVIRGKIDLELSMIGSDMFLKPESKDISDEAISHFERVSNLCQEAIQEIKILKGEIIVGSKQNQVTMPNGQNLVEEWNRLAG